MNLAPFCKVRTKKLIDIKESTLGFKCTFWGINRINFWNQNYLPEYIVSVYSTCYYIILSSQSNCCLIFEWAGATQPRPATSPWLVQGVTNRPYWPAVVFRSERRRAPPSKSANDGGACWTLSLISNSVILILNVDSKCTLQMFCLLNSQMNACEPNPKTTFSDFNRLESVTKIFCFHAISKDICLLL